MLNRKWKRNTVLLLLILFIGSGCTTTDEEEEVLYTLTVENGFGSGKYAPGATVHIWADHDPNTQIVTSWSGDVSYLDKPEEWHTTLTMPEEDLTVSAQIEDFEFDLISASMQGVNIEKALYYHIPQNPIGLIFFVHGTGGSLNYLTKMTPLYVARQAPKRGYGVFSASSEETDIGDQDGNGKERWLTLIDIDSNTDLQNVQKFIQYFTDEGLIDSQTPLFVVGMSNGGAFSLTVTGSLDFNAGVAYCASGTLGAAIQIESPFMWSLCGKDDNANVDNQRAYSRYQVLVDRGITTSIIENAPSPLYDQRFARISGIDETTSKAIADEFRANGMLDENDFFKITNAGFLGALAAEHNFPVSLALEYDLQVSVYGEFSTMIARHTMYDDHAQLTLDFFDTHNPNL